MTAISGSFAAERSAATAGEDVWVFAYGSLMWRPGFDHLEVQAARLCGYHRSLCVYSWVHRGTREQPGLVLGLDRGGSCRGFAYRIAADQSDAIIAYLDERELVTDVYRRKLLPVQMASGRRMAWCYVVRRDHPQYAGSLCEDHLLELVRRGEGQSGRCCDYILSTVAHLEQMGAADGPLHRLAKKLKA